MREFIIYTDASGYGIGSVLGQMQTPALPNPSETNEADSAETGDKEVVIAYTSKHLDEREAKRSTTENKCFAIVNAIEVFRPYLYGRSFTVFQHFTPRKETRQPTRSIYVGIPETEISEWTRLEQNIEYCQILIKRIEAETKQEAKRQVRLNEHIEF